MRDRQPASEEERKWLLSLRDETWTFTAPDRFGRQHRTEKRPLTGQEVWKVWKIITKHDLPCVMTNTNFGFTVGMMVLDHSSVPAIKPDLLTVISATQLPGEREGNQFNKDFDFFARFTHSDRNRQLLSFYGFEPPQSRGHYDY